MHPTSVVHSMVEFVDGSTLVQASPPTMLIPIALGLAWPDRVPDAAPAGRLDPARDLGVLPARRRGVPGRRAGPRPRAQRGGTAPAVYNAANEVCVEAFRAGTAGVRRHRADGGRGARASTTYPRRSSSPSTTSSPPTRGPRRRSPPKDRRDPMTALFYTLGVVIFVVAILASIGLHELGHMIPAKKFGGKVTQYFIGFGPTVWSRQRRRDRVRRQGDPARRLRQDRRHAPARRGGPRRRGRRTTPTATGCVKVRKSNTGMFTQLISDARAAEWEHDQARRTPTASSTRWPWWKKVIVMAGGPTVNILIAFFIFLAVFATYGQTPVEPDAGPPGHRRRSSRVRHPLRRGGPRLHGRPTRWRPADEAGLRPGDVVTSFNGTPVTDWDQLRELIRGNDDGEAVIGYERDGQRADRHHQHHRRGPPDLRDRPGRSARSASSASPRRPTSRRPPAARSTRSSRWAT